MPMRGLHDNIVSKKYKNVKKRKCFFPFIFSLIMCRKNTLFPEINA